MTIEELFSREMFPTRLRKTIAWTERNIRFTDERYYRQDGEIEDPDTAPFGGNVLRFEEINGPLSFTIIVVLPMSSEDGDKDTAPPGAENEIQYYGLKKEEVALVPWVILRVSFETFMMGFEAKNGSLHDMEANAIMITKLSATAWEPF